ncbi:MAG TPA: hypothetical protein VIH33_06675, partial [Candidatus Limnocylindria bacterium]
ADGPLYLWHDFMEIALNRKWDWNGRKPVPQTDFTQPSGVTMQTVCKFSGMLPGNCGETRQLPFLEGTVPPVDNVHTKGCFDVVQEVAQDDRRPQEWIDAADNWASRYVNRQTGSSGDPTLLKENPGYHLQIAPVLGNTGFGSPICGEVIFTPKPDKTPEPSGGHGNGGGGGGGGGDCHGNGQKACSPNPRSTQTQGRGTAGVVPSADFGVLVPATALSLLAWLVPVGARLKWRRRH